MNLRFGCPNGLRFNLGRRSLCRSCDADFNVTTKISFLDYAFTYFRQGPQTEFYRHSCRLQHLTQRAYFVEEVSVALEQAI